MARKPSRRRPAKPVHLPWKDGFAEVFSMAAGWTPPETVKVQSTQRGATMVGVFLNQSGHPFRLTTRLRWTVRGKELEIVEQTAAATYVIKGRAS